MRELDALIVGGGVSGLAIARCLARAGLAVEVWESGARAGGKIDTLAERGYRMESAASMVVDFRSTIDAFIRDVGLSGHKQARAPDLARYLFNAGGLSVMPSGLRQLLASSLFSRAARLRLLVEPLMPRSANRHESVARFITRRLGREFLDKAFEPYVGATLASDVSLAEARSTLPKLTGLESRYGSLALGMVAARLRGNGRVGPDIFSFRGGMATLIDKLVHDGGFLVRTNLPVCDIAPFRGGWMVSAAQAGSHVASCRQLILSTPADVAATLVSALDGELARLLRGIEYAPVSVVHLGFERSDIAHRLDGSGFLLPRSSGFAPNGCLWASSLFPDRAPRDQVLLSTYLGGARQPAAATMAAGRTLDAVMHMLRSLLGVKGAPTMSRIQHHARALPLYHGAYSSRLAAIEGRAARWPGLHLEANYKGGVSIRDRVVRAEVVAARILRQGERALPPRACARDAPRLREIAPLPVALR